MSGICSRIVKNGPPENDSSVHTAMTNVIICKQKTDSGLNCWDEGVFIASAGRMLQVLLYPSLVVTGAGLVNPLSISIMCFMY
jgi:hypothetical protein